MYVEALMTGSPEIYAMVDPLASGDVFLDIGVHQENGTDFG